MSQIEPLTSKCAIISCCPKYNLNVKLLLDWMINNIHDHLVYIMCVPGCESVDLSNSKFLMDAHIKDLVEFFKNFKFNNKIKKYCYSSKYSNFIICGTEILDELTYIPGPKYYQGSEIDRTFIDLYVDIAPAWHINPELFNKLEFGYRIVMGDINYPTMCINQTKAIPHNAPDLITQYSEQEKNIVATKTKCINFDFASQVYTPYNYFCKLPPTMIDSLLIIYFRHFIVRPPPGLLSSYNSSFTTLERLINMFPQNSEALDLIFNFNAKDLFDDWMIIDLKNNVDLFLKKAPATLSKKEMSKYADTLFKIGLIVMYITKSYYKDNEFNEESIKDFKMAFENWKSHFNKYKCDGPPANNLLVAVAILQPSAIGDKDLCKSIINDM